MGSKGHPKPDTLLKYDFEKVGWRLLHDRVKDSTNFKLSCRDIQRVHPLITVLFQKETSM